MLVGFGGPEIPSSRCIVLTSTKFLRWSEHCQDSVFFLPVQDRVWSIVLCTHYSCIPSAGYLHGAMREERGTAVHTKSSEKTRPLIYWAAAAKAFAVAVPKGLLSLSGMSLTWSGMGALAPNTLSFGVFCVGCLFPRNRHLLHPAGPIFLSAALIPGFGELIVTVSMRSANHGELPFILLLPSLAREVSRVELRSDIPHICISIDVCALTLWVAKEKEEFLELPRHCFPTIVGSAW